MPELVIGFPKPAVRKLAQLTTDSRPEDVRAVAREVRVVKVHRRRDRPPPRRP